MLVPLSRTSGAPTLPRRARSDRRVIYRHMRPPAIQARQVRVDDDDAGQRLDNFLFRHLKGIPRSAVYRLLRTGQVRVNGGRAKPDRRVAPGDQVRIPPVRMDEAPPAGSPSAALRRLIESAILYEDRDLIVLNKPGGIAVHGGSGVSFGVIETLRALRPDATLELVHRLDRDTSGCLIVAKRRPALRALHAAFREGRVEKRYLALLGGRWEHGAVMVAAALKRGQLKGGERIVTVDAAEGKDSISHFRPLDLFADASFMEVRIETGRTHQIRVHAAHLGHPVAGDDKYGDAEVNRRFKALGLKRMFLHAQSLSLPRADDAVLAVDAPLGDDLRTILDTLEGGA